MKKVIASLLTLACVWAAPAAAQSFTADAFFTPYDDLLQTHVDHGNVSYNGWAQDPRHMGAMTMLANADVTTLGDKADTMAFWMNAYNLLTIDLIVREQEKESIKNLGGLFTSPWKKHTWMIGNEEVTLDHIEHGILRKMDEPLIHIAINCASRSCPPLYDRAYKGSILQNQLSAQAKRFVRDSQNGVKYNPDGSVDVSMIFKWFADDFGGKEGVSTFIAKHKQTDTPPEINGYLPYDWSLNGTWE